LGHTTTRTLSHTQGLGWQNSIELVHLHKVQLPHPKTHNPFSSPSTSGGYNHRDIGKSNVDEDEAMHQRGMSKRAIAT
jgi:hypothetical protein